MVINWNYIIETYVNGHNWPYLVIFVIIGSVLMALVKVYDWWYVKSHPPKNNNISQAQYNRMFGIKSELKLITKKK